MTKPNETNATELNECDLDNVQGGRAAHVPGGTAHLPDASRQRNTDSLLSLEDLEDI